MDWTGCSTPLKDWQVVKMAKKNDGEIVYVIRGDDGNLEHDLDEAQKKVEKSLEDNADKAVDIEKKKNDEIVNDTEKSVKEINSAIDSVEDISIDADVSQAQSQIDSLQADDVQIDVDADISKAESEIHSISDDKTVDIDVDADVSKAESRIKGVSDDKTVDIDVNADVKDAEDAIKGLEDTADDTADNIKGIFENAMGSFKEGAAGAVSSMSPAAGAVMNLAGGLSGATVAAVGAGAAVVGVGAKAVSVADDIKQAMNQLQSSTGATAEETEKYQDVLEKVYSNNYGEDFNDIADAISLAKKNMGELDGDSLQSATESAFVLRDVFEYDISESTRAAKALMDNYGISSEEAMSKIAAGAQNNLDYSQEFLDSISEYSVQFSKMGFSADEMFHIFQKGTDSGAFNLDKIGDAVKEEAIRVIDLSDSTADAFVRLGLASADLSEPMKKAREESQKYSEKIETLKEKLELAKLKQSEFTDKTSESTKVSTAKSIEKYSKELQEAESELSVVNESIASINEQMENGGPSVSEYARKFAEGGESAREAFDQVLTGIIALNDPMEQNIIGTELFGTMWEDLGPNVVMALGDISDAAYDSGQELNTMKDVKYDDLGSNLQTLKRNLEELLVPLGEALLPILNSIVSVLTFIVSNVLKPIIGVIGSVISTISDLLMPVLEALFTVVSTVFENIASAVKEKIDFVTDKLKGIIDFIRDVFTGNWEAAWEKIVNIFSNIVGGLGDLIKIPINAIIDGLNWFIDKANSIKLPNWSVLGKYAGLSLDIPTIPRLKVGLDYVPSDFYPAFLDEGEAVLTKQENALYRQLGGVYGMYTLGNANTGSAPEIDYNRLGQVMKRAFDKSGNAAGAPEYIALYIDGQEFIRWLKDENEQYRGRTNTGLFW